MNEQTRKVVQKALEALEKVSARRVIMGSTGAYRDGQLDALAALYEEVSPSIPALRQLLEQPERVQEPVAWMYEDMMGLVGVRVQKEKPIVARPVTPLYTTPPAQPSAPEGWKPVPVVPTERMVEAGLKAFEKRATSPTRVAWRAMLAAAPEKGNT